MQPAYGQRTGYATMERQRESRWTTVLPTILLALIAGVAVLLRLYHLTTWQHFFGDEGREMFASEQMLTQGIFPLLGPPLAGYPMSLGPIFYYIIAPAVWIAHYQPIGPAIMIALFGVATVLLLYQFCRDFFESRVAGLVAAALYATSEVVVYHGRYVWNPNLAPFFVTAVLYCLCGVIRGRSRFLPWLGLTLSIATQLQPVLIIAIPAVVVIWVVYRPRVGSAWLYVWAVVLFLVAELPLLIYEVLSGFKNTRGWINAALGVGKTHQQTTPGTPKTGTITRLVHDAGRGADQLWLFFRRITDLDHARYALPLLLVCGLLLLWVAWRRHSAGPGVAATVIVLWIAAFWAGFGLYPNTIYEQYFVAVFPVPFLMIGLAAGWLCGQRPLRLLSYALITGGVVLLAGHNAVDLWHNQFELRPYQMDADQFGGIQSTGMTLGDVQQVVDYIAQLTDHHSFNLVLAASDDHDLGYRYLLHLKGLTPSRSRPEAPNQPKSLDPAVVYPGTARNFFLIIQPKWRPTSEWPSWINNVTNNGNNIVHPDVTFKYALVRYIEQKWAPLDVSPRYNELPCDENTTPQPPTKCDSLSTPPSS